MISTDQLHYNPNTNQFVGSYVKYRDMMDRRYFNNYTSERQLFQDSILNKYLYKDKLKTRSRPWIIFSRGPFGAGKSRCLKYLNQSQALNLNGYLYIDPDQIKYLLPESVQYIKNYPTQAGNLLHTESSFLSLLLQYIALDHNYDLIIDGSMRNIKWYQGHLKWINERYPQYLLGLITVTADLDLILDRAKRRGQVTGRIIDPQVIKDCYAIIQSSRAEDFQVNWSMMIENNDQCQIVKQTIHNY